MLGEYLICGGVAAWVWSLSNTSGWPSPSSGPKGAGSTNVLLAHISPARSENSGLVGTITVDIDHELAQLDATGHRRLRQPETVSTPN